MVKLNLGCGYEEKKGFINIDRKDWNLNKYPYPWRNVSYIYGSHIVEHLDNGIKFIKECHRIMARGGMLNLTIPHCNSPLAGSPYHKSFWSIIGLQDFLNDNCQGSLDQVALFNIKSLSVNLLLIGWINVSFRMGLILENFTRIQEFNVRLVKK